jgi:hypothetical protein
MGQLKAFMIDRYRWICKQQGCRDVLLIQEVFLVINEWGQETGIFIPAFLKLRGTWESSGVPNIELAMMHPLESFGNRPYQHMQELQEFQLLWKRCLLSKDLIFSIKDKIADSSQS